MCNICGGCSLCEVAICQKNCFSCASLCPKRTGSENYISKIVQEIKDLKPNDDYNLPCHIPILPDRLQDGLDYELAPVIGIHAGSMFSRNGERINKSYLRKGYTAALNIDSRCEAVLEFYINDRVLEGFWDNRESIYDDLKRMNLMCVIAPNYSVYEDAPRMGHIYNIRRSMIVYNEMREQEIPAAPDISWYDISDLRIWCDLINRNGIKTVAFSFQVVDVRLKASNAWKLYIIGFKYLCQNIDPAVRIIIAGIISPRRLTHIWEAAGVGRRLTILNQTAYVQSRRGMLSEARMQIAKKIVSKSKILHMNIEYFNGAYEDTDQFE